MNTLHIITAFHIKKMCYVIIFIVSWLIIHTLWEKDQNLKA